RTERTSRQYVCARPPFRTTVCRRYTAPHPARSLSPQTARPARAQSWHYTWISRRCGAKSTCYQRPPPRKKFSAVRTGEVRLAPRPVVGAQAGAGDGRRQADLVLADRVQRLEAELVPHGEPPDPVMLRLSRDAPQPVAEHRRRRGLGHSLAVHVRRHAEGPWPLHLEELRKGGEGAADRQPRVLGEHWSAASKAGPVAYVVGGRRERHPRPPHGR